MGLQYIKRMVNTPNGYWATTYKALIIHLLILNLLSWYKRVKCSTKSCQYIYRTHYFVLARGHRLQTPNA